MVLSFTTVASSNLGPGTLAPSHCMWHAMKLPSAGLLEQGDDGQPLVVPAAHVAHAQLLAAMGQPKVGECSPFQAVEGYIIWWHTSLSGKSIWFEPSLRVNSRLSGEKKTVCRGVNGQCREVVGGLHRNRL
eukprot:5858746-Pyramimonas_sp.AAC.3